MLQVGTKVRITDSGWERFCRRSKPAGLPRQRSAVPTPRRPEVSEVAVIGVSAVFRGHVMLQWPLFWFKEKEVVPL